MKFLVKSVLAALAVACATSVGAGTLVLKPANPQPSGLKPGLNVKYAYPDDVRHLRAAEQALAAGAEQGRPLSGLDYRDTNPGEPALTSKRAEKVAAEITGYVKFDAPGVYTIDFLANDGLKAVIGGQLVAKHDERTPCGPTFQQDVQVPQAGWYPVHMIYFQRLVTSCLHMRMGPQGSRVNWMPNSAFGR
ncbi:MAG: PA14 domain-containing protein [Paracoccaceae bacterium]|jgi:hypothetical protein